MLREPPEVEIVETYQMATGKLIVLAAFDRNDEGDLVPAFDPRQVDTEERAVREARMMAGSHPGLVTWSRDADPALGEYEPSMACTIWYVDAGTVTASQQSLIS